MAKKEISNNTYYTYIVAICASLDGLVLIKLVMIPQNLLKALLLNGCFLLKKNYV